MGCGDEALCCAECGCVGGGARTGWVGFLAGDPEEPPPEVVILCPPRAAAEVDCKPHFAAVHVCAWEPLPDEAGEPR